MDCRHQSAQNCPLSWHKQRLRVSLLDLVRREIVHVFRALVSQARFMLSLARRGESVRRLVDRATRDSEGPASSGEPDKHRGRRHRLPALVLASWAAACMSARRRARARGLRRIRVIQNEYKKIILKNPEDNKFIPMIGYVLDA